ncbi:hypothetical protein [Frankia sp. KB5]|uniref:hypothetical protein n=1 Tax=Frankia sp. KB5 TaxID=683318 RepID=UPI000A0F5316|nr:hypothetical protein [Frankia sp. KB5]ORT47466.1 hypothetical protein KBI5_19585 [Frankia sp. KB5]
MSIPALEHAAPPAGGVPVPAGYPAGDVAAALRWLAAEALRLHDLVVNAADAVPASAVGELGLTASDVRRLCAERGWSTGRLMTAMRCAAQKRGVGLPDHDSLKRNVTRWRTGQTTGLSPFYADLLSDVFGVPFTTTRPLAGVAR